MPLHGAYLEYGDPHTGDGIREAPALRVKYAQGSGRSSGDRGCAASCEKADLTPLLRSQLTVVAEGVPGQEIDLWGLEW